MNAPNPEFEAWVATLPKTHWAKYDLSACRLGWEARDALLREAGRVTGEGMVAILRERLRQISVEGYTPEHDDAHDSEELVEAAACYAVLASATARGSQALEWPAGMMVGSDSLVEWPWDAKWWKPSDDPLRNLEKAGALIAAEYDRIVRLRKKEGAA